MEEKKKIAIKSIYIWVLVANALYIILFYFIKTYFS